MQARCEKFCLSPDGHHDLIVIGGFSAVGYYFALKVRSETGVPIGLIKDCLGGTPAETRASPEALRRSKDFDSALDEVKRLRAMPGRPIRERRFSTPPVCPRFHSAPTVRFLSPGRNEVFPRLIAGIALQLAAVGGLDLPLAAATNGNSIAWLTKAWAGLINLGSPS